MAGLLFLFQKKVDDVARGRKKGCKKTGGRKSGVHNKATAEIKDIIDHVVYLNVVAKKLYELTQGVSVRETKRNGEVDVYDKPPDANAAKTLLEFRFGKPAQSMSITGKDGEQLFELVIGRAKAD